MGEDDVVCVDIWIDGFGGGYCGGFAEVEVLIVVIVGWAYDDDFLFGRCGRRLGLGAAWYGVWISGRVSWNSIHLFNVEMDGGRIEVCSRAMHASLSKTSSVGSLGWSRTWYSLAGLARSPAERI